MIRNREHHFDTIERSAMAGMFLGGGAGGFAKGVDFWWVLVILGVILLAREMWRVE